MTAVAPVVINGDGFWIGWPGIHLENPDEPIPESDPEDTSPTAGLKSEKAIFCVLVFYLFARIISFALQWVCCFAFPH